MPIIWDSDEAQLLYLCYNDVGVFRLVLRFSTVGLISGRKWDHVSTLEMNANSSKEELKTYTNIIKNNGWIKDIILTQFTTQYAMQCIYKSNYMLNKSNLLKILIIVLIFVVLVLCEKLVSPEYSDQIVILATYGTFTSSDTMRKLHSVFFDNSFFVKDVINNYEKQLGFYFEYSHHVKITISTTPYVSRRQLKNEFPKLHIVQVTKFGSCNIWEHFVLTINNIAVSLIFKINGMNVQYKISMNDLLTCPDCSSNKNQGYVVCSSYCNKRRLSAAIGTRRVVGFARHYGHRRSNTIVGKHNSRSDVAVTGSNGPSVVHSGHFTVVVQFVSGWVGLATFQKFELGFNFRSGDDGEERIIFCRKLSKINNSSFDTIMGFV
ncbi:hypothetical protein AGLY_007118 [Aphis glycines]|uniref:Uncharacterized protein n=1 Tax=Aphis glycines TaxID=307491 RepID=A0A6G0TNN2_APHGL|nr:hypothetical protein AGLY_007118 [Aphis glycines]